MNTKMCFVNTAMVAACVAAQGGVVTPDSSVDPTEVPPRHTPSSVEGAVHAGPGDEPGGTQARGTAGRSSGRSRPTACGSAGDYAEAPTRADRSADQWERWFEHHNMR